MNRNYSVECVVRGVRSALKSQYISFNTGTDLRMSLHGPTGPAGISRTAADLLDFAAAVYQIERQLSGRQRTNPPERFELRMRLRKPQAWNQRAISAAKDLLQLLGNAVWSLDFKPGLKTPIVEYQERRDRTVSEVALCSGGLDSTCGAASRSAGAATTQLVSFYTRQKTLQRTIASELGYASPSQWRRNWTGEPGRGRSFYYRSFLFLSLAAVIAESWGARRILQFENGLLATAIPPTPSWMMTKHAHPSLHRSAASLFSALFGGDWQVQNPFLCLTKRGCVQEGAESIGESKMMELLEKTETCWYHWSNRVIGGKKTPAVPCGICIPCIIRRTAIPGEVHEYDLCRGDEVRNHPVQGRAFRSYFGFLEGVLGTEGAPAQFYALLPAAGRRLVGPDSELSLADLHKLFLQFAGEFRSTYRLDAERT